MAAFRQHPDDYQRLDYRILKNSAGALYSRREVLDEDTRWLSDHGYRVVTFDCATWTDQGVMHTQLAELLGFPDWYGRNLDALYDCLKDVATDANPYWALRLDGFGQFAQRLPDLAQALLAISEDASRDGLLFGYRLIALVEASHRDFHLPPYGERALVLNPREAAEAVGRSQKRDP